ncbi:MAG: DUF2500 domain-containing protein [Propionicimonas sp.]
MSSFMVVFFVLFSIVAVAILGVVMAAVIRGARKTLRDDASPQVTAEARVVDKRTEITGGGETPARQTYYVTFQFPDGGRLELGVPATESGLLVVGDRGTLSWQGSRYLGFAREILR